MPGEEGVKISWLWLLIILLLGEMGRELYKKHKEREEERLAAVKAQNQDTEN